MNQIGMILGNDFRQALINSENESRKYEKKSTNVYKPDQARYKMVIWFKDGNKRCFYSYDHQYHNKVKHLDEYESLVKLLKLMKKHEGNFKNCIIYATLDPERDVKSNYNHIICWTNIHGNHEENKSVRFLVDKTDNLLHLKHLEAYTDKKLIH